MKLPIVMLAFLAFGCSRPAQEEKKAVGESNPGQHSTVQEVVEGMTGYTDVKAGQRAKKTIQKIADEKNKDMREALGDK